MAKIARWAALALFCAVFGFLGCLAAVATLQAHLTGERGPAGPIGPAGPRGVIGPAGADADVARLQFVLDQLDTRVSALEARGGQRCALATPLVMDVTTGFSGELNVSRTPFFVCVNPE